MLYGRCYCPCGRWNSHCRVGVLWQMLMPCGRWNGHRVCLLQFQFWGVKQKLIPYVWQMVFAYVSVKGWIVDTYVQSFFDSSHEVFFGCPKTKLQNTHFLIHYVYIKLWSLTFSSDLRKLCCKLAKDCLLSRNFVLFLRKYLYYITYAEWETSINIRKHFIVYKIKLVKHDKVTIFYFFPALYCQKVNVTRIQG